jgi:hypothetical protein
MPRHPSPNVSQRWNGPWIRKNVAKVRRTPKIPSFSMHSYRSLIFPRSSQVGSGVTGIVQRMTLLPCKFDLKVAQEFAQKGKWNQSIACTVTAYTKYATFT